MNSEPSGTSSSLTKSSDTSFRVLVIDDDSFMRSLVTQMLRQLGVADISEAENGMQALAAIQQGDVGGEYDFLVCDLDMPESDGMEFMRRAGEIGSAPPLLVLSGKSSGVLHSVGIMGAAYGLTILGAAQKPPTLAILREALDKCGAVANPRRATPKWDFSTDEILEAIEKRQFEPFFQPKVHIESRGISGCEALVRWRHPTYGILPPGTFLGEIEANGLMDRLTWSIVEQSTGWCRRWRESGRKILVSVNLSMSSFEDPHLTNRMTDIVRAAGLVPNDLILEITETIAMLDVARCLETLVRLRLKGFGLSIDDFGTGFSSLQQLERVPYTELKIDREFVNGAATQERLRTVLESSVSIAKRLGITSVAEGVETAEDWECLREIGCDVAQGYLIAKPMSGNDFLLWIENWERSLPIPARSRSVRMADGTPADSTAVLLMDADSPDQDRPPVIVVADDDPIMRRALELILTEVTSELQILADGQEVIDAVERLRPDLVIVDIDMPVLRGDDICRRLRLAPHTAGIPVIIITGDESSVARRSALLAGATDFVTKPVQKLELLMRVRNLLALQRSQRELNRSRIMLEAQRTQRVRETFERYVSPRLVDQILQRDGIETPVGLLDDVRRCHAVVLFADLRGFTHMSEVLEPGVVAHLLNEFFALLVNIAHMHEGTTLNMAGDCLLVAFNVPCAQPDGAIRAVRAAHEMLSRFEALARDWEQSEGVRIGLGIGINAGSVVAGNIGAPNFLNFTLVGDAVNVASRLKDRARAGEILITEQVLSEIANAGLDLEVVKVPVVVLKGKSEPIDVYSILVIPRDD